MNTNPYTTASRTGRATWFAVLGFVLMLLAGCKEIVDLQTGLTDEEANEIVGVLQEDGITAHKRVAKDGISVALPEENLSRAATVLKAHGLPQRRQMRLGEVFKKDGLISTPMEERARYISALSQELEYTLAQIDGVVVARVHVVLPEKVAPGEPVQPSSAAVFIKHAAGLDPDVISPRVRQLVARSIPGLGAVGPDKVSVVFVEARPEPTRVIEDDKVGRTVQMRLLAVAILLLGLGGFVTTFAGNPKWNAWMARFKPARLKS
jgi:type III secretion protein J